MAVPSSQQILDVLSHIQDPDLGRDVVSLGMIKELDVSPQGKVTFTFELTTPACPVRDRFKSQAQDLVGEIPGVTGVEVHMTANVRPAFMRPKPSEILPGVKQTIAVASGKGGVGKSTVAVNLAAALRKSGASVGLLDADIYGPSVPAMTGSKQVPEQVNGRLQPIEAHGLKLMSFGHIYPGEQPTIYRGPMVGKAIEAMMIQVDWGQLDYLVIDLPPGTGDASLTLAQAVPLTGVAIVCTPQDVATDIAVKALQQATDPKDKKEVAQQLKTMKYTGISGPLDFTAGPQPGIALQKVCGGQWRPELHARGDSAREELDEFAGVSV